MLQEDCLYRGHYPKPFHNINKHPQILYKWTQFGVQRRLNFHFVYIKQNICVGLILCYDSMITHFFFKNESGCLNPGQQNIRVMGLKPHIEYYRNSSDYFRKKKDMLFEVDAFFCIYWYVTDMVLRAISQLAAISMVPYLMCTYEQI